MMRELIILVVGVVLGLYQSIQFIFYAIYGYIPIFYVNILILNVTCIAYVVTFGVNRLGIIQCAVVLLLNILEIVESAYKLGGYSVTPWEVTWRSINFSGDVGSDCHLANFILGTTVMIILNVATILLYILHEVEAFAVQNNVIIWYILVLLQASILLWIIPPSIQIIPNPNILLIFFCTCILPRGTRHEVGHSRKYLMIWGFGLSVIHLTITVLNPPRIWLGQTSTGVYISGIPNQSVTTTLNTFMVILEAIPVPGVVIIASSIESRRLRLLLE